MELKDFSILYVEDSITARKQLEELLKDKVQNLYFANDGKDGISQFAKLKPDIVISDINMPNIDGLEMSRIIKKSNPRQRIILLTEFENINNLRKAIEIGVNSFIAKPLQKDELFKVLETNAIDIQCKRDSIKYHELKINKEKIELIKKLIHEIGHHWKQPLTTILALSSGYQMKNEMNLYKNEEERFNDINTITDNIHTLADIFKKFEELDLEHMEIEEIERIFHLSKPIYKDNETI